MKVFKINDCDYIVANTEFEAKEWHKKIVGEDIETCVECDSETETMQWGVDFTETEGEIIRKFLKENKDKKFIIKYDRTGDFDCVVELTFKEVLSLGGWDFNEPFFIASIEM
jgi:hypothetical protein